MVVVLVQTGQTIFSMSGQLRLFLSGPIPPKDSVYLMRLLVLPSHIEGRGSKPVHLGVARQHNACLLLTVLLSRSVKQVEQSHSNRYCFNRSSRLYCTGRVRSM
jgi:hypothetical protein